MPGNEIFRFDSNAIRLSYSGGELKTKESDSSTGFAVRVLEGGRIGFGHCQHESEIQNTLAQAKSLSRFAVRSGFTFAPKGDYKIPDILDSSVDLEDAGPLRMLVDQAREAASSLGGKPRVISSLERTNIRLDNSEGLSGSYAKTVFSMYVECMHDDGFGFHYASSHHVPKDVAQYGLKAAEMASSMRKAGKPESGTYTIVMGPEALENLIETLLPSLSGDWKRRGITKLADKKYRFSEKLSIYDDALAPGISARPFDDEGTPSERRALIEKGEVKSFLYDRETAALDNVKDSGSCMRGSYDSPPGIGASNLIIAPGDWDDLAAIGRHLEIRSAHGSHTANPTTGDIGLEVSAAYLVDKGQKKPLKGFMLSGNVFDMFANIEAVESEQKVYGSLIAPRMAFRDVRVVS
ncbi:MAG: TldD/PmbA family protein [Candidatus Micrarchaeota archaeon]